MRTNGSVSGSSHLSTIAWFVTKGLRSRRSYIAMVIFITAVSVTELSILISLTSGITRLMVVSTTLVLSVLAISEVIVNAILQRAYRVGILMAFGAKRRLIALLLLTESALGSLLGSLTGSLMGIILIFSLRLSAADTALYVSSLILPFFLGLAIGVLACVYPILKIMEPSISERY